VRVLDVRHVDRLRPIVERAVAHANAQLAAFGCDERASVDQTMHMLHTARSLFGEDFTWSAAGVGYPAEYQLAALGIMLGGQMRVGLEDNLRLSRQARAQTNAELVEKGVRLAELFDRPAATPDQARAFFGLKGMDAVNY